MGTNINSGWCFETFFIFPYIQNNHPNWLICFRGVGQPPTRTTQNYYINFNQSAGRRARRSTIQKAWWVWFISSHWGNRPRSTWQGDDVHLSWNHPYDYSLLGVMLMFKSYCSRDYHGWFDRDSVDSSYSSYFFILFPNPTSSSYFFILFLHPTC